MTKDTAELIRFPKIGVAVIVGVNGGNFINQSLAVHHPAELSERVHEQTSQFIGLVDDNDIVPAVDHVGLSRCILADSFENAGET